MQRVLHFAPLSGHEADPDGAWESVCLIRTYRYIKVTKPIRSGTNQLLVTGQGSLEGYHCPVVKTLCARTTY